MDRSAHNVHRRASDQTQRAYLHVIYRRSQRASSLSRTPRATVSETASHIISCKSRSTGTSTPQRNRNSVPPTRPHLRLFLEALWWRRRRRRTRVSPRDGKRWASLRYRVVDACTQDRALRFRARRRAREQASNRLLTTLGARSSDTPRARARAYFN